MKTISERIKQKPWLGWLLFFASIMLVFILGFLASSIIERRTEALFTYTPQVEHDQYEPRDSVWGQNFPREYQSYLQTSDTTFRSMQGGSAMIDMLEENPEYVILWANYSFSKDYNQGRGHYYAITDLWNTLRTGAPFKDKKSPMPNTCWSCKSPDVPRLMSESGPASFYKGSWEEKGAEIVNPIGCADCHDAKTMNLRITRPALIEAFERQGKNILMASHQEMRSLVCAQCHVEYYFNKELVSGVQYLTFPWDKGTGVEQIESYYDDMDFSDWIHGLSRAPMLKAQHPDYEVFSTGIHASRGVACADCHMPYISEGGQKFTNHHIQSPLNNIASSCQVCHRDETEEIIRTVYKRQNQIAGNRKKLERILVQAHIEARHAWDYGASQQQMTPILKDIRHAQWRWDFAAAGHGNSFHNPVETSRIIASGITIAQESRIKLTRLLASLGHNKPIEYPDITTKAKAQKYLGMDIKAMKQNKETFLSSTIPQWLEQARTREKNYSVSIK